MKFKFTKILLGIIFAFFFSVIPQISHAFVPSVSTNAMAYIAEPADGAIVPQTFKVQLGLSGMDLAPAGVEKANAGHHHLLIDNPKYDIHKSLPFNEQIVHLGMGDANTEITLSPGEHTLQLLMADHLHVAHSHPVMSEPIKVTVR